MKNHAILLLASALLLSAGFAATSLAADATPGHLFYYTSAGSAGVNSTGSQYARFTATETSAATNVSINLNPVTGAPVLTVGLQLDDGTGKPTGTFVASGTVTAVSGWNTVTFANYTLEEGKVYHVVTQAVSGSVNWRLLNGTPGGILPYGYTDTNFARGLISNGIPQTPTTASAVVYNVGTTGTHGYGQVYTGGQTTNAAFVTNGALPAQRFIFHTPETGNVLTSVSLRLTTAENLPAGDVTVALLSDTDVVLGLTTISPSELSANTTASYIANFAQGVQLTDGEAYRLAVYSEGSAPASVRWYYMTTDNAALQEATFQGTDGYAFLYSDKNFTARGTSNLNGDYVFSYTTIPEPGLTLLLGAGVAATLILRRSKES